MARRFQGGRLVIATHNPGKLREIQDLLGPFGIDVVSAGALGLPEPVENGDTFVANALIKSRAAAMASGLPALADDSGLAVDALGGQPGIHSARWAGPDKDFNAAMEKVWDGIKDQPDRRAHFVCVLALSWPPGNIDGGTNEVFEGRVGGKLVWPMRGDRGFGYDPMFVADGYGITFGEMAPAKKHAISHRAVAFRQLSAACFGKDD
ncbi:MAG: RdgB/HAM1 family non-canonical purine NTP pyrophosphatase [Rhodospirillaceae bacterium]